MGYGAMNRMLVASPEFEYVTYALQEIARPTIKEAELRGLHAHVLYGHNDTRANYEAQAPFNNFFFLMGHGGPDAFTGQDYEVLLDLDNVDTMTGSVVYALSCLTGQVLGPAAVGAGATAYIGYVVEYGIFANQDKSARNDPLALDSILPALEIVRSLYRGETVAEAVDAAKRSFNALIEKWRTVDDPVAPFMVANLQWDRDALTFFGDGSARVSNPYVSLGTIFRSVIV